MKIGDWHVLDNDTRLIPKVQATGSIIHEPIVELPEFKALGKGDFVIDIGAFIGDTALPLLLQGCKVLAFEPYYPAFECLVWNLGKYIKKHQLVALNHAVGDTTSYTEGEFGEDDGNPGSKMMQQGSGSPSFTLDSLIKKPAINKRCSFLKIDCEGWEPLVLKGGSSFIRKYQPVILIEVYGTLLRKQGFNKFDVFRYIERLGYDCKIAIGSDSDDRADYIADHYDIQIP